MKEPANVLVVDDDQVILEITLLFLKMFFKDTSVMEAANVKEADVILKSLKSLDLLITDFDLPDGKGAEIISVAKSKHPEIKALLMSGLIYNLEGDSARGADAVISKPFPAKKLVEKLRGLGFSIDDPRFDE